jgi:hypothetical protein
MKERRNTSTILDLNLDGSVCSVSCSGLFTLRENPAIPIQKDDEWEQEVVWKMRF